MAALHAAFMCIGAKCTCPCEIRVHLSSRICCACSGLHYAVPFTAGRAQQHCALRAGYGICPGDSLHIGDCRCRYFME